MTDVVLGDDHATCAAALATVIEDEEYRVLAVERTAADVLAAVRDRQPDLLLVGRWFEDGDVFGMLPALREVAPRTWVLVISADAERDVADEAFAAGAHGFVHKTRGASALLGAIPRVLAGARVVELPPRWDPAHLEAAAYAVRHGLVHRTGHHA